MVNQSRKFSQKKELKMTDAIRNYQKILEFESNEAINFKEEDLSDRFDTVILVFAGDWHLGIPNFNMANAIETINYVLNTPNAIMFCLGDMLNTAILNSISDNFEDSVYPQEQWRILIDMLTPVALAGKLTVLHEGNHERRIQKQTGINVIEQATRAMETYNNRGVWTSFFNASAPYYAERKINLFNNKLPNNKFELTTMTHHGDGVSNINQVNKLSSINSASDINVIGHLHKYQMMSRTIKIADADGKNYRHRVIDMILPSNGEGYYGYMKMFGKKYSNASVAVEVTSVDNPLYDENSKAQVLEPKYIPAFREIPIQISQKAYRQAELMNSAARVIKAKRKQLEGELNKKLIESEKLLEEYGLILSDEVAQEWNEVMNKHTYKPKRKKAVIRQETEKEK